MVSLLKAVSEIKILVVDDNPDNLSLIAQILESEGYQVRKARSGKMALQGIERYYPDLILLDINMPEMNGYEVCQALKKSEKTAYIPIIFISALNQIQDKVNAFEMGGSDYISKPFHDREIQIRIKNQLLIQQQHQLLLEKNQQLEQEVQERLKAEARAEQLAITDELTGLLNRRGFLLMANQQLKISSRTQAQFSLLFADVDGLKKVNDNFGHLAGDQVIIDAAKVLQQVFREGDILSRVGGDEFAVFLPVSNKMDDLSGRLKASITEFNNNSDRLYKLSISFGIVEYSGDNEQSLEDYLNQADKLMYEQKRYRHQPESQKQL